MHTPTVATLDLAQKTRRRVSNEKHSSATLEAYRLEPFGLYFRINTAKGLKAEAIQLDWLDDDRP